MKKIMGAFMLLFGMTGLANADSCQSVQVVQQAQIVTPLIQTQTLAVPVVQAVVPIYSAVYNPQVQNQQDADNETLLKILEELKAMRQEINSLKVPVLPVEAPKKEFGSFQVVKNSCYGCHNSDKADDLGGGFVMFKDPNNLLDLEEADKKRIVSRVSKNSMPPPEKKISAEAKSLILSHFKK